MYSRSRPFFSHGSFPRKLLAFACGLRALPAVSLLWFLFHFHAFFAENYCGIRDDADTRRQSLLFAARGMARDIKPHLQNIADRYAIAFNCCPEDCLWVFWNS